MKSRPKAVAIPRVRQTVAWSPLYYLRFNPVPRGGRRPGQDIERDRRSPVRTQYQTAIKVDPAATAMGICDTALDMVSPFEAVVGFPPGGLVLSR